jgi:hypothetical protein
VTRGIAELVDQPEPKLAGNDSNGNGVLEALVAIAHRATPWLRECIEAFLEKTQENERTGYAV